MGCASPQNTGSDARDPNSRPQMLRYTTRASPRVASVCRCKVNTRSQVPSTAICAPVIDTPPVALLLGQVDPLRPSLELPGDRIDHLTVVPPPAAPLQSPVRE